MSDRFQRGFSIALTLMVTAVLTMLAAGIILRIIDDVKGAKSTSQSATLANDADLGLRMAENEIYKDIDQLDFVIWTAISRSDISESTATESALDVDSTGAPSSSSFPLRDLEILGNARNWPAFADWNYYTTSQAYSNGYTAGISIGSIPTPPGTIWNKNDRTLTRGWWMVPRDDLPDIDYYDTTTENSPDVFPTAITGVVDVNKTAETTYKVPGCVSCPLAKGIHAVKHNFWYQHVLPIKAQINGPSKEIDIPNGAVWPNREEYGTGGSVGKPKVFDTPFYKKIYTLQSNRRVAVYVRVDLRDYFKPLVNTDWTFFNRRFRDNYMRVYMAAVPEGRIDVAGGLSAYRPGELTYKYIYIATGGMELSERATSSFASDPTAGADDRQYPGTLLTSGGVLRAGSDLKGMIFRGDGNLGFNWSTLSPSDTVTVDGNTFTPPASERFVYVYEIASDVAKATPTVPLWGINLLYTSYNINTVTNAGRTFDKRQWCYRRVPLSAIGNSTDSAWNEPEGWLLVRGPAPRRDATNSLESTFSAIVDQRGFFTLNSASGCAFDPMTEPSSGWQQRWRGPESGYFYYAVTQPVEYNRVSLKFPATQSVTAGQVLLTR